MDKLVYTGSLTYKDICFTFVFTQNELRLIPPKDKAIEIQRKWLMSEIAPGTYIPKSNLRVEDEFLKGICNESGKVLIFITDCGALISSINEILIIDILAVLFLDKEAEISKMNFTSTEINYIFNSSFALAEYSFSEKTGEIGVKTRDYQSTTTEKRLFLVDKKKVYVNFSITRTVSTKISSPTLDFVSNISFEFDLTSDYMFIYKLYCIIKRFLEFLCYRKNVNISGVGLLTPYKEDTNIECGKMIIINRNSLENDDYTLEKGRYISQKYLCGYEGEILSKIANETLYLRHLPDTYDSGRNKNAARFVMITAAFEWEFSQMYPDGVNKSEKEVKAEQEAAETIKSLIDNSTGKLKAKYKFLKRHIKSDSLKSEIFQIVKDFRDIIEVFGKHLYGLNDETLNYSEMSDRLSTQRNNFAHGNLDKEFIGSSLLDLIFLERIIYAMQLKSVGVSDVMIQKAINDLFGCNIAFNE